ncbi:MAG: HNH endonuclease [Aureispira sp.]|nr:HNH endonuclease [Aureispira sp.]
MQEEKIADFKKSKFVDLEKLVKIRQVWQKLVWGKSATHYEHQVYAYLYWWSGYGPFRLLEFIYMYSFYENEEDFELKKLHSFTKLLIRYLLIYSIRYRKVVNRAKTFCYDVIRHILKPGSTEDSTLALLKDALGKLKNEEWRYNQLTSSLKANDIFEASRKKNLLTRLSAMLEEKNGLNTKSNYHKYFEAGGIDIEHIHPRTPQKEPSPEWASILNGLGNLVVLEFDKNRSISNSSFNTKQGQYKDSKFPIVKKLAEIKDGWTVEKCKARQEVEVQKILDFLFEGIEEKKSS